MLKEFKEFAMQGNVLDLAIGVIIGAAFGKIVTSLVNDIIMPLVGIILGGYDFKTMSLSIGESTLMYGAFIQNIVDFIIVAFVIFISIRTINRVSKRQVATVEKKAE
jgi:large conductance mechanosensitive channel